MDPTTLTIGGLAALAAFNGMQWWCARRDLREAKIREGGLWLDLADATERAWSRMISLNHLRSNAFITNERGHRVRYVKASQEARAKAEGGV